MAGPKVTSALLLALVAATCSAALVRHNCGELQGEPPVEEPTPPKCHWRGSAPFCEEQTCPDGYQLIGSDALLTFVNKEPHRLHCFYNKNSTFIHGTEGEEMKPCFGQQEIHNKITSIGFEDCKVFIHSVDAQSSANGGIIIQVIGEMSNHGDPWRKFVQTFFLAEQPNGYFVLNDIFRFLKEETVESDDASEAAEPVEWAAPTISEPAAPVQPVAAPEPVAEVPREPTPPPPPAPVDEPIPAPPAPVDEAPTTDVAEPPITQTPTPAPEQQQPASPVVKVNGIHAPEVEKPVSVAASEPSPAASPAPQQAPILAAPAATPAPPPTQAAAPPAAPQPAAPSVPRSWASLAASNPKGWGAAVAQQSRGTTETVSIPAPAPAQAPIPAPAPAPQRSQGQQGRHDHPSYVAAQSVTTASCFVKGVLEPISQTALQSTLTTRFGAIKELEIVRSKACAFIEFQSVDSAKRAIIASLNQHQGGDGGVWIDVGGEVGQVRITVETKKERGDRPVSRPRGGAPPVNGDGRGSSGGGGRGGRGGAGAGGSK
ncbi:hypothetical protein M413DRAFT_16524 [Hebeloma cylindrosporum]|uniref:NTF2 domain-containing protein n=1 Tax=Hebeloma cylindrosporum TaxID=76867 RepID=A0A0C3CSD8_HEBCY|nr:hypothetical protein M413DRAFT_16524 [Hebeloma cylindrosporum h7]